MAKKSMIEHFSIIKDPRIDRTKKHKLIDILVIAVCGFLSKCETWVDIEDYGNSNLEWLNSFLHLDNGIPSHDTFGRVFSKIDPIEFNKVFYGWVKDNFEIKDGEIICIDGKYMRATASDGNTTKRSKDIKGTVNAFASNAGIALAQKKTNFRDMTEMKVFKELIEIIDVKSCIVTMDAAGCHAETLNAVTHRGGDYSVALKKNQKVMYRNVEDLFKRNEKSIQEKTTVNKEHGRQERRTYQCVNVDEKYKEMLVKRFKQRKTGLIEKIGSITKVISWRKTKDKERLDERYYLSSLSSDVEKLSSVIRSHWHIENRLHWTLDVAFEEDQSTARKGDACENMSLLRKFCFNLLKKEESKKSINRKRLKCSWEKNYLLKVLYEQVVED